MALAKNKNFQREIDWLLKEKYKGKLTKAAAKDIERIKMGGLVDYAIGFVKFLDCKIDLSKKPLIPRPETEYWVSLAIAEIKNQKLPARNAFGIVDAGGKIKNFRILDIFAGSGCVGVSLLKHVKNAKVDFAEVNKNFLGQIKINAKLNKINPKRYKIIESDLFQKIKGRYDYILANPPYIAEKSMGKVQKSVLKFEPKSALFADRDGLFYIKKFLLEARKYLKREGKIYLEFDSPQKKAIEAILQKLSYPNWQFSKDQYEKWRCVRITNN